MTQTLDHRPERTAISRYRRVSAPTRWLSDRGCFDGFDVMHYGEGMAFCDTDLIGGRAKSVEAYDPYSIYFERRIWQGKTYDVIVCNYVLNVLPPAERAVVLDHIKRNCKYAYITVRTDKVNGTPVFDGVLTSKQTFQKSYKPVEAAEEFGHGIIVHKGSGYVIILVEGDSKDPRGPNAYDLLVGEDAPSMDEFVKHGDQVLVTDTVTMVAKGPKTV